MSESILLKFLQNGLIDVGGDDVKFEKITGASGDFAQVLGSTPSKAVSAALLAFDQGAPANDPLVSEVLDILKQRWPTYMNTFAGVPIAVVRGILLNALVQAANKDERVAIGFASAARNVLPFMELGSEREIWRAVVAEIEELVDQKAEVEWATPETIHVDKLKYSKPAPVAIASAGAKVNREWLQGVVTAAGGPNLPGGVASGENPNPYWPQNQQNWLQQFGIKMSAAIADAVDGVARESGVKPVDLAPTFEQFASEVANYASSLLSSFSGATTGLQRRTQLLWWKEALFSPSARISYRTLDDIAAASLMAFDLFQKLPMLSPASVQSFLAEAVRTVQKSDPNQTVSLQELVRQASTHRDLENFRNDIASLVPPPEGRGYLISLICHPEKAKELNEDRFRSSVGLPGETKVSLASWAEWVFRELQAARATREDSGPKRKSLKGDDKK